MISVLPFAITFTSPAAFNTAFSPAAAFTVSPTTTTATEPVAATEPAVTPPLTTILIKFLLESAVITRFLP